MDAVIAAGLELITLAIDMVKQSRTASAEKSADIATRFDAARAALAGAYDDAHAALAELAKAAGKA